MFEILIRKTKQKQLFSGELEENLSVDFLNIVSVN